MAGNITNYLENKILEHTTGKTTYTRPSATYLSLYTVSPTDTTAGTEVTNANNYARVAVTWGTAANGSIANSSTITFPTASGTWGTVIAAGLSDSSTWNGGNLLWYGPLGAATTINNADTYVISVGGLQLSLD